MPCSRSISALPLVVYCGRKTHITAMPSRIQFMSDLCDTRGRKMCFNAKEEQEIYFQQLKMAWI